MTTETETVADVVLELEHLDYAYSVQLRDYAQRIAAAHAREVGELESKYNEILLSVGNKYPGESRHETALRYIKQAETTDSPDASMSSRVEVIR